MDSKTALRAKQDEWRREHAAGHAEQRRREAQRAATDQRRKGGAR
jgi:hypothetical protein